MTCNHTKPKTAAQPAVTLISGNALWQKVTSKTAAQVSGGGNSWS